jgi:hypothetical protein
MHMASEAGRAAVIWRSCQACGPCGSGVERAPVTDQSGFGANGLGRVWPVKEKDFVYSETNF